MTSNKILFASASALALLSAPEAWAQTASDDAAETTSGESASRPVEGEIVVTARRREENLLDVPVAVSALTSDAIEATGVKNIGDISNFTPGLILEPQGTGGLPDRSANSLVFRGLSTTFGTIFINGAPYTGTNSPDVTDIERFEVLTGPQSVYFGRSTFSGAINYVTKTPSNEFQGRISAEASTYNTYEVRGSIEGAIIDDILTARLSARHYETGGQYRSAVSGLPLGEQRTDNISVAIAAKPSDNLDIGLLYSFSEDEDSQPAATKLRTFGTTPVLDCNLGGTSAYYCGALPDLSDLNPQLIGENTVFTDYVRNEYVNNARGYPLFGIGPKLDHFGLKRRVHHVNARIDYETDGGWQISALGSYTNTKSTNIRGLLGSDTSNIPNPFPPILGPNQQFIGLSAIAQRDDSDLFGELRVSSPQDKRIRATIGSSYFKTFGEPAVGFGLVNIGRLPSAGSGGLDSGSKTPAVFGGVYFDLTDQLTISAEARYQWDKVAQQSVLPLGPLLQNTFTSFSPRVTVDYEINPDHMIYATFSRGYNPGGFNPQVLALNPVQTGQLPPGIGITYDQEKLDNFEFGHKGKWLDGRLRTTLALYHMKFSNGQVVNDVFLSGPPTTSLSIVTNVGKVDLWGAEFSGNLFVNDNFSLAGTVDYNDNDIKAFTFPDGNFIQGSTNVTGNMLDHVSKWRFSLSPTFSVESSNGWTTRLRLDWLYRSKWFIDPSNTAYIKGRSIVNARMTWDSGKNFEFEIFAKNLLNDDTLTEGLRAPETLYSAAPPAYTTAITPTVNSIFLGLPEKRTFGAKATIRF